MGRGYDAICHDCGSKFSVHEGSGMIAMPFHCERCGKEWWWEFGPGGPVGDANPPPCDCAGSFSIDAPVRCPSCRSTNFGRDPEGLDVIYD